MLIFDIKALYITVIMSSLLPEDVFLVLKLDIRRHVDSHRQDNVRPGHQEEHLVLHQHRV